MSKIIEMLSDDDGRLSSVRCAFAIAVVVSTVMSIAGIYLAFHDRLTWVYVGLTLAVWLIATLQKNWAKHIEKLKG